MTKRHFGVLNLFLILLVLLTGGLQTQNLYAATEFDHFATGFPLTGGHRNVECDSCHLNGLFTGTPDRCDGCHNNIRTDGKSSNHVQSNDQCDRNNFV